MMASRTLEPEVTDSVALRWLAVHLVERGPRDGDRDGGGAAVPVRGGAAVGGDVDEEDEDSFAGEVGGSVADEDFEVFAGFAGVVQMSGSG